jgi:hypothetical protein
VGESLQTTANVTQIISLFIAVIALTLQGVDAYLKYKGHLAPTLKRLQDEIKQYLPIVRYTAVASFAFYVGSCAATPTTRIVVDLQATNVALSQTIEAYSSSTVGQEASLLPTNTMAPEITTIPSVVDTVTPSTVQETTTPPPTVQATATLTLPHTVFFADDFSQGIKPEWTIIGGDWLALNDKLTPARFNFFGDANISIGTSDWTNYDLREVVGVEYPVKGQALRTEGDCRY